ncbi:protein Star-like isoform X2 [Hyalella azteca]|nr:protein Star-like isoform X2 [Hyalella azteca]
MPASTEPYAFAAASLPSDGQATIVDNFFKQKTHGLFVECGAFDGQYLSNTLFLERFRAWTGLLIEPEPSNFEDLKNRHRKALIANSCLSSKPHPSEFVLRQDRALSEILDVKNISYDRETGGTGDVSYNIVQCFPFYSFLLAANITTVDYFSLDVEGQEFNVLKTIPWHRVDIKVISVEHKHVKEGKAAVNAYMATTGYVDYDELADGYGTPSDVIYVRRDLLA